MYKIRTAAKALIIRNDEILLIQHEKGHVYYTLPGGGQEHNEKLSDTLKRECVEELGAKVDVGDISFVFEFIADKHMGKFHIKGFHQLDVCFNCTLVDEPDLTAATETDGTQIGYEWIDIDCLNDIILYPMAIRQEIIKQVNKENTLVYLGDIK